MAKSAAKKKWDNVKTARKQSFRQWCEVSKAACHICGEAIDYSVVDPDADDVFSIDHVLPRHLFLDQISYVGNWRASHRGCNMRAADVFNKGRGLRQRPFEGLVL